MLKTLAFGVKDMGRRSNQEDSFLVSTSGRVFAVADGMGGYEAGEIASALAIQRVEWLDTQLHWCTTNEEVVALMDDTIDHAKEALDQRITQDQAGTTITILVYFLDQVFIAHIGDSRALCLERSQKESVQLTKDHSLVEELIATGKWEESERDKFLYKNVLVRALQTGDESGSLEHATPIIPKPGQVYLLHTDGLTIRPQQIRDIVFGEFDGIACERACDRLIQEALSAGSEDNITVVLVQFIKY